MFPLSLPANAVGVTFKGRTFNQVVSRNTVPGEMPWRVTRLDADGVMGHTAMLTLCGAVRYAILDDGEVIEVVTQ
jgi:hypothetical protein